MILIPVIGNDLMQSFCREMKTFGLVCNWRRS